MGAYSPVPVADESVVADVLDRAVLPTLRELRRRHVEYRGVLYAGLMLTPAGVKVLEYNVRFGDPECQAVVPRLDGDLAEHCVAVAEGRVLPVRFTGDACVTVALAGAGYPGPTRTGDVIEGLDAAARLPGVVVFHAGTKRVNGDLVTAGGRVLNVTATAPTLTEARARAYTAVAEIDWPGMHYRHDIAARPTGGRDLPSEQ
jgi:phosphoribosylamine--glycine ligase